MLAWPRVHKAADWTGVESRFGPHFPAVEGRKIGKGIAALLGTFYLCSVPFRDVCSGDLCTRVYCVPTRLFRSVVRKDATRC